MDEQDDYIPQRGSRLGWRVGGSIDPMPCQDVKLPPRMPEAAEIARLTAALAEAEARTAALVAAAHEAAATAVLAGVTQDPHATTENTLIFASKRIRALILADATAALDRMVAEARAEGMRDAAKIARYYFLDAGNCADRENCAARIIATAICDRALAQKEAASDFPPPHCTAWEDCNHDGICHDPKCCGATGPNHEAFYGEAGE